MEVELWKPTENQSQDHQW